MPEAAEPTGVQPRTEPVPSGRRGVLVSAGAVGAAFLASLCCTGPLLFVVFGVGAGIASSFEPLRPLFTALTVALIGLGFYTVYGKRPFAARPTAPGDGEGTCEATGRCVVPRGRRRDRVLLWTATALALLLLTFPEWSRLLVR